MLSPGFIFSGFHKGSFQPPPKEGRCLVATVGSLEGTGYGCVHQGVGVVLKLACTSSLGRAAWLSPAPIWAGDCTSG